MVLVEKLGKPLPKPGRDPVGYAAARVLEALLESILTLEFLGRGYTRNAVGKAFQAWRALTGTLLALEGSEVVERLGSEEQKRCLLEKGMPRVPSSRLRALGQLIEGVGVQGFSAYTAVALLLHDYQYHGPDPSGETSKYAAREEAARDILYLLDKLAGIVEKQVKPILEEAGRWTLDHEEALQRLREKLTASR